MSRSKSSKNKYGSNAEYWYREANSDGKWFTTPGKVSKRIISRRNRRKAKRLENGES